MKSRKNIGIIYYGCAAAFYVCGLMNIFNSDTRSMGIIWLCMGSTFLCLGSNIIRREKKSGNDKDDNNKDDKNEGES